MTLECGDANHVPAIHKEMPTYASPQAMVHHGASLTATMLVNIMCVLCLQDRIQATKPHSAASTCTGSMFASSRAAARLSTGRSSLHIGREEEDMATGAVAYARNPSHGGWGSRVGFGGFERRI
uniref:Uncharacterized protein n=1 Tax=Aegilops tauschii subsp. strangulata TaxID=200361 RepID=A0A453CE95_AEGTS